MAAATASSWWKSPTQRREALEGYLWISPWVIGFLLFTLGPMIGSLYLSMTSYKIGGTPEWLGFDNYIRAFSGQDKLFWDSLWRTVYFAVATVILGTVGSLLAAILLNQNVRGRNFFRALFYLPSLTPVVALAILWQWLLQPQVGFVNYTLYQFGIEGPGWMTSRQWALPSLILISLWAGIGGGRMIIFLAGLQGVPIELYESAELDGASTLQRFFNITLPMISPVILFNVLLGVIGSFSVFSLAYVATDGGPSYATYFYVLHLYYSAFTYFQMGYASALAWVFFLIIFVLSFIQIKTSDRWVYYEFS